MFEDFVARIRIDRGSPVPLYYQLMEQIRSLVTDGSIPAGVRINTERELMAQLNLSYNTVTRALRELVQQGLLEREQGRGTFVAERKSNHTTIALVMPHLYLSYDQEYRLGRNIGHHLAHAIEVEARAHGANILLYLDDGAIEMECRNLTNLIERKVDAAIVLPICPDEDVEALMRVRNAGVPLVLMDRYMKSMDTDYVGSDNYSGAFQAVGHLVANGFESIHYLTPEMNVTSLHERLAGYCDGATHCGLETSVHITPGESVISSHFDPAYALARDLLPRIERPAAVFTANSAVLAGVVSAIDDYDISHDGLALASFDGPYVPMSSDILFVEVMQPLDDIGRAAVRLAMDRLRGSNGTQQVRLEPGIRVLNRAKHIAQTEPPKE